MKFGSVQFFKRIILVILVLFFVVPVALAIAFGVMYNKEKQRADWLETVNWALLNSTEIPEDLKSADQIAEYLQNPPQNFVISPSFEYQTQYADLYFQRPEQTPDVPGDKVCYLTFDDGPTPLTMQLLKTLDDYGVKATFL